MNKNKGFSLVELIVVVAIMAVLVAILAPAYLSYVEKTRKGTDEDTSEKVRASIETALASDLDIYDAVNEAYATASPLRLTWDDGTSFKDTSASGDLKTLLEAELGDVYGDKTFAMKSKAYKGATLEVVIWTSSTGTVYNVDARLYKGNDTFWKTAGYDNIPAAAGPNP